MHREPEQDSDETVIELACHYRATRVDAEVATFIDRLAAAWGHHSGRGDTGSLTDEDQNEVRLSTSFVTGESAREATSEALGYLSSVLAEMDDVPGVELAGIQVELIPGDQHAAHLDALAAR